MKKDKGKSKFEIFVDKYYMLVATLVFAVCVAVVFAVVFNIARAKEEKERKEKMQSEIGMLAPDGRDYALEKDAHPEINEVITRYHKALAEDDEDTISDILVYVSQNDLDSIAVKSEYIDSYDDIVCYTQKAEADGAYYVYVQYNLKLKDFDTKLPGLIGFYYCPDEEGNPKICRQSDISEDVISDFYAAYSRQEVQDLYNQVALAYNEALDKDEELKSYMDGFDDMVKQEMVKKIALRSATEEPSETSSEETSEPAEENTTDQVEPITTVNIRATASEKGESKGQVGPGTTLTRIEELINGWSHVIYNGEEGYIRSDYLKVVGSNTIEAGAKTVTVKEGVNIRNEASMDGSVIAMAEPGTKLELIEKMDNGWSKVKYNGQTAYVKSDYVE